MALGHRALSTWYRTLAQHLDSGQPLATALRASQGSGPRSERLEAMANLIEQGGSTDDALSTAGRWLPESDALFLSAASEVGRLPQVLHHLADRHHQLMVEGNRLAAAAAYPGLLLHAGAGLFPVLKAVTWTEGFSFHLGTYLAGVAQILVPVWLSLGVLAFGVTRPGVWGYRVAALLPFWSGYTRLRALSDFVFSLGILLQSGVAIDRAWQVAGVLTPSPTLRHAAETVSATIERGQSPAATVRSLPCFPAGFAFRYETAQTTGTVPETLLRLATETAEQASVHLRRLGVLVPLALMVAVVAWTATQIIGVFARYLDLMGGLGGP